MTNFTINIRRFADRAGLAPVLVQRKVALDILTELDLRSPVLTGRYRGNNQTALGVANLTNDSPEDPSGGNAVVRGAAIIAQCPPDVTIVLSNNVPYAKAIEDGHSAKAPAGVYAVAAAKFRAAFGDALTEVRRGA